MLTKMRKQNGFTIIELLIVIAIIGILATLVLTNFRGAQAKGRDTVRTNDINSMFQKLEEYYNEQNNYPTADFTATLFPGIDEGAFDDPTGVDVNQLAPIVATSPAVGDPYTPKTKPTANGGAQYTYEPFSCTGTVAGTDTCAKYELYSWSEAGDANFTRKALN